MTASWKDINKPPIPATVVTAAQVANGPVMPPQQRLLTYSPGEWEGFVEEWAYYCLTTKYEHVQRFSGAGDMGIDVAGFADGERLQGIWENFQCKHYDHAIRPSDVWTEFGKVIWYSYKGEYAAPVATILFRRSVLARRLAAYSRMQRSYARNCLRTGISM